MSNEQTKPNNEERQQQVASWTARIFIALGLAFLVFSLFIVFAKQQGRFDLSDMVLMPIAALMFGISILSFGLIRRGRLALGVGFLFVMVVLVPPVAAVMVLKGFGITSITYIVLMASIMIEFILPRPSRRLAIAAALIAVLLSIGIDLLNPTFRVSTDIYGITNTFTVLAWLGLLAFYARQYRNFSLRIKLLVSILLVSILSVAIIGYFAYSRFQQSQSFLSGELQTTVQQQARLQLNDTSRTEANNADQTLLAVSKDVETLAAYRASLYSGSSNFETGSYWDGHTQLIQLAGGQYGNSKADVASVFIPSTISLNDSMILELNTSAYLGFVVPAIMKSDQTIIAIYFISKDGSTTYYPNIDLAENVPQDFDPRTQAFYKIATPENDPKRKVLWTEPYQDPAGTGLIVTSAAPVYDQRGQFRGVLAADVQLVKIADQIGAIQVGQTGFAFLIDPVGHLIAMHEASTNAFLIFGLSYEQVAANETPKQTVLNHGPADLQAITLHMVAGESGLATTTINKIQYYVVYTPLPTIGYSLGLIVPVAELEAPYLTASEKIQNETSTTLNLSFVILALVLMVGTGMSMFLSQSISKPLVDLTQVVRQISLGNLGMRAQAETQDETGMLAGAFNAMTTQLRDLIGTLEQRVADRTKALATSTEVSRRLSTILNRKELVTEVVDLVNNAFGYYHTQIYFYDEANDNLVMAGGTGEAGEKMLAQFHKVAKGRGLVGRAAESNQAVLVSDTSQNPEWLANPLLPETKSEVAIPISIGDEVLGVLDVQQNVTDGLKQEDVDSLQSIANQMAVALQNSSLYARVEESMQEAQLLMKYAPEAVVIVDLETGFFADPNENAEKLYGLSHDDLVKVGPAQMSPPRQPDGRDSTEKAMEKINEAMQGGAPIFDWIHRNAQGQDISCEVRLVRLPGTHPRVRASVTDISERKRLEELTIQRAKQQEALNIITQKIQNTTSIEVALQIAARELGRALGTRTSVRLKSAKSGDDHE